MKKFYQLHHAQRFSIRKFSFGAASVLVGTLACLNTSQVSADEVTEVGTKLSSMQFDEPNLMDVSRGDNLLTKSVDETTVIDNIGTTEVLETKLGSDETSDSLTLSDTGASLGLQVSPTHDTVSVPVSNGGVFEKDGVTSADESLYSAKEGHKTLQADDSLVTNETTSPKIDQLSSESQSDVLMQTGFAFRTANRSTAIGDNYPQVWKNGIIGVSADKWRLYVKECVSFVAFRLSTVNGFEMPPAYGNANLWGHNAKYQGYRVDMTPGLGSVAWFDSNQYGAFGNGHVAWVSNVMGDQVELEEYNFGVPTHAYHRRVIHKSQVSGYIHFKDLVGGVPSTSSKPTTSTSNSSSQLAPSGTYTFTKPSGIKAEPKMSSPDLAHYAVGQSVNYDQVMEADGYQWISYLSSAGNRRYIPITPIKAETPKLSGKMVIKNQDNDAGTFDVVISRVPQDATIRTVKVGVWSVADGKDDLVWHTARKQSNGQYKVSVDIAQHDDYRGEYRLELRYVTQDRQKIKVATKTVVISDETDNETESPSVSVPTAPSHNLPPRGTYRFTQRSDIKAEPKMSSANLAYYNVGDTVNYDSIVQSEGKNWLSYLSYSGNRRYIALP